MAKTDDTPAQPGDGPTPPVEPSVPDAAPTDEAATAVAEANDAADEPIKVRLTITPDIETELLGGEAERLDLERQGLIYHEPEATADGDTEGSK